MPKKTARAKKTATKHASRAKNTTHHAENHHGTEKNHASTTHAAHAKTTHHAENHHGAQKNHASTTHATHAKTTHHEEKHHDTQKNHASTAHAPHAKNTTHHAENHHDTKKNHASTTHAADAKTTHHAESQHATSQPPSQTMHNTNTKGSHPSKEAVLNHDNMNDKQGALPKSSNAAPKQSSTSGWWQSTATTVQKYVESIMEGKEAAAIVSCTDKDKTLKLLNAYDKKLQFLQNKKPNLETKVLVKVFVTLLFPMLHTNLNTSFQTRSKVKRIEDTTLAEKFKNIQDIQQVLKEQVSRPAIYKLYDEKNEKNTSRTVKIQYPLHCQFNNACQELCKGLQEYFVPKYFKALTFEGAGTWALPVITSTRAYENTWLCARCGLACIDSWHQALPHPRRCLQDTGGTWSSGSHP
jgi:hypothetical protein